MKTRTIEIAAYRDIEDGNPTCRGINGRCQMLVARRFGSFDMCAWSLDELFRDDEGKGWLRPNENCPVWQPGD